MTKRSIIRIGVALAIAFAIPTVAKASPVVSGQWYCFSFGGPGSFGHYSGCEDLVGLSIPAPGAPWTYMGAGTMTVLDGYLHGDRFELFDGAGSLGLTSVPGGPGGCYASITACLADPDASKGTFAFGAGLHSFKIQAVDSPFGGGDAWFRIDEPATVPEPASLGLLATGLLGIVAVARRRRA